MEEREGQPKCNVTFLGHLKNEISPHKESVKKAMFEVKCKILNHTGGECTEYFKYYQMMHEEARGLKSANFCH